MDDHVGFGWILLAVGLAITGLALIWIFAPSIPWVGRLPGDIHIEKKSVRFYFPLTTCLLVSLLLSLILWIIRLFRG